MKKNIALIAALTTLIALLFPMISVKAAVVLAIAAGWVIIATVLSLAFGRAASWINIQQDTRELDRVCARLNTPNEPNHIEG